MLSEDADEVNWRMAYYIKQEEERLKTEDLNAAEKLSIEE